MALFRKSVAPAGGATVRDRYPAAPPEVALRPGYWVRPPATVDVSRSPGHYVDPSGRHKQRWWDGSIWTNHVADGPETEIDLRG
jgi:hypothetical protein